MNGASAVNMFDSVKLLVFFSLLMLSICYQCPCGRITVSFDRENRTVGFRRTECNSSTSRRPYGFVEFHELNVVGRFYSRKSVNYELNDTKPRQQCSMLFTVYNCEKLDARYNLICEDFTDRNVLEVRFNDRIAQLEKQDATHILIEYISGIFATFLVRCDLVSQGSIGECAKIYSDDIEKAFNNASFEIYTRYDSINQALRILTDRTTAMKELSKVSSYFDKARKRLLRAMYPPRSHLNDHVDNITNWNLEWANIPTHNYSQEIGESDSGYSDTPTSPTAESVTTACPDSWISKYWWIFAILLVFVIVGLLIGFFVYGRKLKTQIAADKKKREDTQKEIQALKAKDGDGAPAAGQSSSFVVLDKTGSTTAAGKGKKADKKGNLSVPVATSPAPQAKSPATPTATTTGSTTNLSTEQSCEQKVSQ